MIVLAHTILTVSDVMSSARHDAMRWARSLLAHMMDTAGFARLRISMCTAGQFQSFGGLQQRMQFGSQVGHGVSHSAGVYLSLNILVGRYPSSHSALSS